MFGTMSGARIVQVRMQLANLRKNDMTVVDYYAKTKTLVDTMASIGNPLLEEEIISHLLAGLSNGYDALVTLVSMRPQPMLLSDVYEHLLSYDM